MDWMDTPIVVKGKRVSLSRRAIAGITSVLKTCLSKSASLKSADVNLNVRVLSLRGLAFNSDGDIPD